MIKKILFLVCIFLFAQNSFAVKIDSISTQPEPSINNQQKVFSLEECKKLNINLLELQKDEVFLPRYDGKNFFLDVEGFRNTNQTSDIPKTRIREIINKATNKIRINNINELIGGLTLNSFALQTLPLVIEVNSGESNIKYDVVILSLTFTSSTTKADFAVVTDKSPFKNAGTQEGEEFYLGATDVEIRKGGKINGNLTLISPKRISLLELDGYGELDLTLGTGICMSCESNQNFKFNIAGSFIFDPAFAKAEKQNSLGETTPNLDSPELFFSLEMTQGSKWETIIAFKLPLTYGIVFNRFEKLSFWSGDSEGDLSKSSFSVCNTPAMINGNVYLDLSEIDNPVISGIPSNFNKGLVFSQIKVLLPQEVANSENTGSFVRSRKELDLTYFVIGDGGVAAKGELHKIDKKLKLGTGYDITLQDFGLEIENHNVKQFYLGGDLRLPIFDEDDYALTFTLGTKNTSGSISLNDIYFSAGYKSLADKNVSINLFGSGIQAKTCGIYVGNSSSEKEVFVDSWDFSKLSVSFDYLLIKISDTQSGFFGSNFYSEKLTISNTAPFVRGFPMLSKKVELDCNRSQKDDQGESNTFNGFEFTLSNINYEETIVDGGDGSYLLSGKSAIKMGWNKKEKQDNPTKKHIYVDGGAEFLLRGLMKFNEAKNKYRYSVEKISFDNITATAKVPAFEFNAKLDIIGVGEERYGIKAKGGFEGEAEISFAVGGKKSDMKGKEGSLEGFGASALFLNPLDESLGSAWAVDVKLSFDELSPIQGLRGGFYKNLAISKTPTTSEISKYSKVSYLYVKDSWGFQVGAKFMVNAVNVNALLLAQGQVGGGLDWIKALAYVEFPVDKVNEVISFLDDSNFIKNVGKFQDNVKGINESLVKAIPILDKEEAANDANLNSQDHKSADSSCEDAKTMEGVAPPPNTNRIGAGAVLTICMNPSGGASGGDDPQQDADQTNGYFSIYLKPDIQLKLESIENARLSSTGYGLLFVSNDKKYLHIGKPTDRLGLLFNASTSGTISSDVSAYVNAYFQLGDQITSAMPEPLVPQKFKTQFLEILNSLKDEAGNGLSRTYGQNLSEVQTGTGIAMGAAVGINFSVSAAFVVNASAEVGAGFDALLVKNDCPGWQDGSGNWQGGVQLYGYGNVNIKAFTIDVVDFGLGFFLKGTVPKLSAKGVFLVYLQVWKSKVQLSLKGSVGNEPTSIECLPDATPSNTEVYAEIVADLSPQAPLEFERSGILKVKYTYPKDQIKSGQTGGYKQLFQYRITNKESGEVITKHSSGNPGFAVVYDVDANPAVDGTSTFRLKPELVSGKEFTKGKAYQVEITSKIYDPNGDAPDPDSPPSDGTRYNEVIQVDGNIIYHLSHKSENSHYNSYDILIGENDFLLQPEDVVLYPAQNQFNVYREDYDGKGYFKVIDDKKEALTSLLAFATVSDPTLKFYFKIFDENNNIILSEELDGDWETDFNISNLLKDKIYQAKVIGHINGIDEVLFDQHFFRIDNFNTLTEKLDAIANNHNYTFNSAELGIEIDYDGSTPPDLLFSKEEKEEVINIKADASTPWFNSFTSAYNSLSGNTGTYFASKIDKVSLEQAKFPYLVGDTKEAEVSKKSNLKPKFIYAPFEEPIWGFLTERGTCIRDPEFPCDDSILIPLVEIDEQHCFEITYSIRNLTYYQDGFRDALLPTTRFPTTFTYNFCFENKEEIDFNDVNKIKKIIEVSCKRGRLDSNPTEFSFSLKRDETALAFVTPIKIDFRNINELATIYNEISKPLTFEIISNEDGDRNFVVYERKSVHECPTTGDLFTVNGELGISKYSFEVIPVEREIIKPCVSFKDVTLEEISKFCNQECNDVFLQSLNACELEADPNVKSDCINAANSALDICKAANGCDGVNVYSGDKQIKVEAWEDEETTNPQNASQSIVVRFKNGKTVTIPEGKHESGVLQLTVEEYNDLEIEVNAADPYKCGINIDKKDYTASLISYSFVGEGTDASSACSSTKRTTLFSLTEPANLIVNSNNGTKFFSNNTVMPAPDASSGFYTQTVTGGEKEFYQLNNSGQLVARGYCAVGKPVLCIEVKSTSIAGGREKLYDLTYNFYTSASKENDFIPQNLSESGLTITLANGAEYKVYNGNSSGILKSNFDSELEILQISPTNIVDLCTTPSTNCSNPPSTPTLVSSSILAGFGETITLTASGCTGGYYLWYDGSKGESIEKVITEESSYAVKCVVGNCISSGASVGVKVRPLEIVPQDDKDYACSGSSKTLVLEGCSGTISWSADSNPAMTLSGADQTSVTFTPVSDVTLRVKCATAVKSSTLSFDVALKQSPVEPTISLNPTQSGVISSDNSTVVMCIGEAAILNATACSIGSLIWSDSQSINPYEPSPQTSTVYTAKCKDAFCESPSKSNALTVIPTAVPKATIENPKMLTSGNSLYGNNICAGNSFVLTASNCDAGNNVSWFENSILLSDNGATTKINDSDRTITLARSTTSTDNTTFVYTAQCTQNISSASKTKICTGAISSSVTVKVINEAQQMTIGINAPSNSGKLCSYSEVTLVSTGCPYGEIQWKKGAVGSWVTRPNYNVKGSEASDTYYARCNLNDECIKETSVSMTKVLEPIVDAPSLVSDGDNNQFCEGSLVTLSGNCSSGASLSWENLSSNTVTPTYTSANWSDDFSYKAFCTLNSGTLACLTQNVNRETLTVKIFKNPPVPDVVSSLGETDGNNAHICEYDNTTISVNNYTGELLWKVNATTEVSARTYPSINTSSNYQVRSKNWNCYSGYSNVYNLTVHDRPSKPEITPSQSSHACSDNSNADITLTSNCPNNHTTFWYKGGSDTGHRGGSYALDGSGSSGTYTILCQDNSYKCNSELSAGLVVDIRDVPTKPTITSANGWNICDDITTSISSSCAGGNLSWDGTGKDRLTNTNVAGTYKVICTIRECPSVWSNTETLVVNATPAKPTISKASVNIFDCGDTIDLEATDSDKYEWSNGLTSKIIDVGRGTYWVKSISNAGCISPQSNDFFLDIRAVPATPSAYDVSVCAGQDATISASGCNGAYNWNNNLPSQSQHTLPGLSAGEYFYNVSCTESGCTSQSKTIKVTVIAQPTWVSATLSSGHSICSGNAVSTTSIGCSGGITSWTGGITDNGTSVMFNPTSTTTYTQTCNNQGCTISRDFTITVNATPNAPTMATAASSICTGQSTTLTATCQAGYVATWTNATPGPLATSNTISKSIDDAQTYSAYCYNRNGGCMGPANSASITINAYPTMSDISFVNNTCNYSLSVTSSCSISDISWSRVTSSGIESLMNGSSLNTNQAGLYKASCSSNGCVVEKSYSLSANHPSNTTPRWVTSGDEFCSNGNCVINEIDDNPCTSTPENQRTRQVAATGCPDNPTWTDTGTPICTTSYPIRTCTIQQTNTNSVSCSYNSTRNRTYTCNENLTLEFVNGEVISIRNATSSGCSALSFSWKKNGVPTEENSKLFTPTSSGIYSVSCLNPCGSYSTGSYNYTAGNR